MSKDKVILKNGKQDAVLNGKVIGTWDYAWSKGAYRFSGKTTDGTASGIMKKRELRDWFAKEASK